MQKGDEIRLQHILDSARVAMAFVDGKTREDLDKDKMLVLALVKAIEIVGEAAYKISQKTRSRYSHIPWNDIIGMRHRLVHVYFDINLDVLWKTVQEDIPYLITQIEPLVSDIES